MNNIQLEYIYCIYIGCIFVADNINVKCIFALYELKILIMAIIDVVKCEMTDSELCKKFHSEDLRLGSQLVVHPSQVAIFVKGGQIFDIFESGTYTLKTSNIPLLNKIINLPFGGDSPFQAEVWFLNLTAKLDVKWGTMTPIQLEDPKYEIIVPVRAYGQYGMKVIDPQHFLKTLIGNMTSFSSEKVNSYFKGKMLTLLNSTLAKKIANDKISILDINTHLVDTSEFCEVEMNRQFEKYGLQLLDFAIISINVPDDDPSIIKLKEAKDLAARLKITGRDVYQMERSFNVLETAAGNEGAGGQMIGVGAGIGAGIGLGSTMGSMTNQFMNTNPNTPPPLPQESTYFIFMNGQQLSGQTIQNMAVYIQNGMMNGDTLVWRQGMPQWIKASQVPELASLFNKQTPPPIPSM